jgi:hypothetical protein
MLLNTLECEPLILEVILNHVFALYSPGYSPAYIANYFRGERALGGYCGISPGAEPLGM